MKSIDNIISDMKNVGFENLHPSVPLRDRKILKNIAHLMSTSSYITEAQGKLLLKILKENIEFLNDFSEDLIPAIKNPVWTYNFRAYEKYRQVSIEKDESSQNFINVKFNFDKSLKIKLNELNKAVGVDKFYAIDKTLHYTLVEKNVVLIYEHLKPLNFQFSTEFLELYKKIQSLDLTQFGKKFTFDNLYNEKIKESTRPNIEDLSNQEKLVILDRKIRYQYEFSENFEENEKTKLSYKIANRNQPKIFINNIKYDFDSILQSLLELKRPKILVVFDEYRVPDCIDTLKILAKSLKKFNLQNNVGIYFRFDSKGTGSIFNGLIADNGFNKVLNETTNIVGISNGKIPKFMMTSDWYPDAVISFTSSFRNNRSMVYCNDCDLVVYYLNTLPMNIKCDEIL